MKKKVAVTAGVLVVAAGLVKTLLPSGPELPPAPPGMIVTASRLAMPDEPAVAVVPSKPLPFDYWFRRSGGWTLISIAMKSNVTRFRVEASTNVSFGYTNAAFNIVNPSWPWTNHLQGFNENAPGVAFGPPAQMFFRVIITP